MIRNVVVIAMLSLVPAVFAQETKVQPVRMGTGVMTFDTVPGWGLNEAGKSQLGPTHGGVVVDKKGTTTRVRELA